MDKDIKKINSTISDLKKEVQVLKKELKDVKKKELIMGKGLLKLFHVTGWIKSKK